MSRLPEHEAQLLAVYFEETAHFQAQQMKEHQAGGGGAGMDTYDTIGDDDAPELFEYPDDEDE